MDFVDFDFDGTRAHTVRQYPDRQPIAFGFVFSKRAVVVFGDTDSFADSAQLTDVLFKNLKARSIGPAVMGGRVSDIAIDPRNPFIFYVGLGHGGVFKTNDNGVSFEPIFDKQPMLSIGAVAVAPSDSDVIWVGTGEANDRNSSGWGDGVYRSTDGGEKWQNVGLKNSRTIARDCCRSQKTGRRLRRCDGQPLGGWRRTRIV